MPIKRYRTIAEIEQLDSTFNSMRAAESLNIRRRLVSTCMRILSIISLTTRYSFVTAAAAAAAARWTPVSFVGHPSTLVV